MNSLKNSVQLIGNLGQDVDFKSFDNGKTLAKFSLATNEYYKNNKGEKVQDTQWHNIVAWGKTAELANNILSKGHEVCIKGKLVSRSYEDKEGAKKYTTEVLMNEFVKFSKEQAPF